MKLLDEIKAMVSTVEEKSNSIGMPFVIKGKVYIFSYKTEIYETGKGKAEVVNLYYVDLHNSRLTVIRQNVDFIAYRNKIDNQRSVINITRGYNLYLKETIDIGKTMACDSVQRYATDDSYLLYPLVYAEFKKRGFSEMYNVHHMDEEDLEEFNRSFLGIDEELKEGQGGE